MNKLKLIVCGMVLLFLSGCALLFKMSAPDGGGSSYNTLPSAEMLTWEEKTLPNIGYPYYATDRSFCLDSNNALHYVYADDSNYGFYYLTNKSGSWESSLIKSLGEKIYYAVDPAIAVDSNNNPHIVSHYENDLKYYKKTGTTWESAVIDANQDYGRGMNLAIDNNDTLHLALYNIQTEKVYYYSKTSTGTWEGTALDSVGYISVSGALPILADANGKAHLIYYNRNKETFNYATNKSGNWVKTTIDSGSILSNYVPNYYSSLFMDKNGNLHFAGCYGAALGYSNNSSGAWLNGVLILSISTENYPQLLLTSANKGILFYDTNYGAEYGVCSQEVSTYGTSAEAWRYASGNSARASIYSNYIYMARPLVKIDSNDKVHLIFLDSSTKKTHYLVSK